MAIARNSNPAKLHHVRIEECTLNQRQTVEIAAMIAAQSAHVIEGTARVPDIPLQKYWTSTKQKMSVWRREIDRHAIDGLDDSAAENQSRWRLLEPILEEIFVSEILTRVWGAVLTASDQRRGIRHAEPFARSTLIGHLECRHLALNQLVNGKHVSSTAIAQVDRFRRRTERWTDMCLGHLLPMYAVRDFAFDARRANDFGEDPMINPGNATSTSAWTMVLASLRMAFPETEPHCRETIPIDQEIHDSIIACFPPDAFHRDGSFKSLSLLRIGRSGLRSEGPLEKNSRGNSIIQMTTTTPILENVVETDSSLSFSQLRRRKNEEN